MTATTTGSEKLDIGTVIQGTFDTLRRNFVGLLPAVVGLLMVPGLASGLLNPGLQGASGGAMFPGAWALYGSVSLLGLLGWAVFQTLAIRIFVSDLDGGKASLRDNLRPAMMLALPVLGLMILQILAIWAGCIFLLVPGLMIATAFSVAIQVRVVERVGVFAAFGRSRALTRGNRWRIFLLVLIYLVIFTVFEMVLVSLTGGFQSLTAGRTLPLTLGLTLLGEFAGLLGLAGASMLYVELRRIKDGVGPSDLAAVFD